VKHFFKIHWKYISNQGFKPNWHYVGFDGCTSQFKSSKTWYFVLRYLDMTSGCEMMWSFFGSGHGKGP
jgi:hypothetical protein